MAGLYEPTEPQGLGKYWYISVGLHVGLVLFAFIGAVVPKSMPDVAPPPIYVEFAPVAERAAAPTKGKAIETTKKKEPEPEPIEPDKPKPKNAEEPKVEPKAEEKKAEKEPEKAKETTEKVKEDVKADKPKPKEEKKEVKEAEKAKDTSSESFDALLKNLSVEESPEKAGVRDVKAADNVDGPSGLPDYANELTISEFDALRAQLARCWNVPAGARDADSLVIEIAVNVNQDKIATSAKVVDQLRYTTDTFFRAAAESAVRAVRAPECTPLELPDDKYDAWKSMIIVFDPREMF